MGLDAALRRSDRGGGLGDRQVGVEAQDHHLALSRRQQLDGADDRVVLAGSCGVVAGRPKRRLVVAEWTLDHASQQAAMAVAHQVDEHPMGVRLGRLVCDLPAPRGPDQRDLHQILGFGAVARQQVGAAGQLGGATREELVE
jgi:hypothetical protein